MATAEADVKKYENEHDGQIAFFDAFGIDWENNPVLVENTDGIHNGVLFEFKLSISNLNSAAFQAIKYLSARRLRGEDVPATFLLVALNEGVAYEYKSKDYKADIHKVYTGSASKNNAGFVAKAYTKKYEYYNDLDASRLRHLLKDPKTLKESVMPIDIDENCIVAWAERYYAENPTASKGDFLGDDTGAAVKITGEIRKPRHFKDRINKYTGKTNEKFKYLMDCLNDRLSKKDLGAFYTPIEYARKAGELVLKAIERVPDGNDYIILDRCAGTGNLEAGLIGLTDKNGEELISHCVVSTYEYYEYKVLQERLGDKVREIIPPTEANVVYEHGTIANADAMSEEFINNEVIRQYIDNPKCSIILLENPPYRDASAANKNKDVNSKTRQSFVSGEMAKVKSSFSNKNISTVRDLTNQFVWSGFRHYLRQSTDSYVLFSPIKWWKECGIADYKFIEGFCFNREFFHASAGAIICSLWANEKDDKTEELKVIAYGDATTMEPGPTLTLKKCHATLSAYYEKKSGSAKTTVFCESSGYPTAGRKCDGISFYSEDNIAYLTPKGFTLDANNNNLVRMTHYNNRGTYITRSNYLRMCPLFVAKEYPKDEFYEKGEAAIYYTTSDGGSKYTKDKDFLKSCLIYTCLSNQNKCLSFYGNDGRDYQNELCFEEGTLAKKKLDDYTLNADEKELIALWDKILAEAKKTANYNSKWKYGIYQIAKELNTFHKEKIGKKEITVYDYVELNGYLEALRKKLKAYYKKHITPKMFKYELLK